MKKRLILLAGLGIGYVLGSRTGRQSYERLKEQMQELWSDPRVQGTFERANQTIRDRAPGVADVVQNAAHKVTAAGSAVGAGTGSNAATGASAAGSASTADATTSTHPDSVPVTEIDGDEDTVSAPASATESHASDKAPDVFGDPERNLDDEGPAGVAEDD